jgi:hypothetical protein
VTHFYVIEARHTDGRLDLSGAQPESVFGTHAITGITEDAMAKTVYRLRPDAVLMGSDIPRWPSHIDSRWSARRKTW